jgi:hypothetical protein
MDSYILKKIAHLKRIGLVAGSNPGIGQNGGACPDWLRTIQKEKENAQ